MWDRQPLGDFLERGEDRQDGGREKVAAGGCGQHGLWEQASKGGLEARPLLHRAENHFLWQAFAIPTLTSQPPHPCFQRAWSSENQTPRLVTVIRWGNVWEALGCTPGTVTLAAITVVLTLVIAHLSCCSRDLSVSIQG